MKSFLAVILVLFVAGSAGAAYYPKDFRLGASFAFPIGDIYDSASGVDFQYRMWRWETTSISIVGSIQQWKLSTSSPLTSDPGFVGYKASPAFVQLGVGLDERRIIGDHARLNLHADIRYYNGISGAKARISNGEAILLQDIDVSDAIVGSVGAGVEFDINRSWTLFAEVGFQAGLVSGEIGVGGEKADNELEAPTLRLGAVLTF